MQQRGPNPYGWGPGGNNMPVSSAAPITSSAGQAVDAGGNPLDPYDHIVRQQQQQQQQQQQMGGGPRPFLQQPMGGPRAPVSIASSTIGGGGGPLAAMQQQFSGDLTSTKFLSRKTFPFFLCFYCIKSFPSSLAPASRMTHIFCLLQPSFLFSHTSSFLPPFIFLYLPFLHFHLPRSNGHRTFGRNFFVCHRFGL